MSVDGNSVRIPLSDKFETISIFIEQYKQNDAHPLANVAMYALREGKVSEIGRISKLQATSLDALPRQQMLFVSYTQNKKQVNALCAGTSTVKDVNLLRKFIEGDQTVPKESQLESVFNKLIELEKQKALLEVMLKLFSDKD